MAKPIILAVDDDRGVLNAVERDLRRKYGKEYRVVAAESGDAGLQVLDQLAQRDESVALFLVDQRMPHMTGVEFLGEAIQRFPQTKRVLLTAYADTEAAIRAINEIRLDHYLLKPWDPPEERLYPVLDDLLEDWRGNRQPTFEGVRVIGHRWSPEAHAIRDFLARNMVPYRWLDIESDPEAVRLAGASAAAQGLPVVFFADGSSASRPGLPDLAAKVGLKTQAVLPFYDLIVVGSGPAGLAAAVYGTSEGLRTLVVEREAPGGQAAQSSRIENYLGFPVGLSGADLTRRGVAQATRFGAEILTPVEAIGVKLRDSYKVLALSNGEEVSCHALLVATGVAYRKLDAPGIDALAGSGVFYGAALTEAMSVKDTPAYVVGGGNSAGQAAMYLSRFASYVGIVVRGDSLTESMSQYLIDQIAATGNIEVLTRTQVAAAQGEGHLESLRLLDLATDAEREVAAAGLFIFIGAIPRTEWLAGVVQRDKAGFIPTGPELLKEGKRPEGWPLGRDPYWLEASSPGIFVAGDVRARSVKRIASAVGEGSMAVQFVHQFLAGL